MEFEIKNKLNLSSMKPETRRAIRARLTMPNPAYQEAQRLGRYTGDIESELKFYDDDGDTLICPRGASRQIYTICQRHDEAIHIIDNRRTLDPVDFIFHGSLRPLQVTAVESCLKRDFGLLKAGTGAGKTVMALYLIATRKQSSLIVVHTKELLNQWCDRIEQFLKIPRADIGVVGSGKFKIGDKITVAMIQTLVKKVDQVVPHIGYLILDECHRAPAMQYVKAIEQFDCKYLTGLTATPLRRDGLSKVIFWHIGDVTGRIDKADLLANGNLCQAGVHWIQTDFDTLTDTREHYSAALSELTEDYQRNRLICDTVTNHDGTGINLILSDRKKHCKILHDTLLTENGIKSEMLIGSTSARERERIIEALQQGKCRYLVATGQLIGEGFDLPGISSIFLTTPVKFSGRLIQYIGRALRPTPGKDRAVIFDFVDIKNGVFKASATSRHYTYEREGIQAA